MYNEPIFLNPVFQERIWGGNKLQTLFGYDIPSNNTGEAWVISAHPNGPSEIVNGPLQGKELVEAWKEHPEIFGETSNEGDFPLLVKILDANKDLSVQVHPDDTYAREVEGEGYGKTECWYVLDCAEDAEIIFGHHARSPAEFRRMVDFGNWQALLRRVKVQKGDFIYVPSGTIHAIGKGIVVLEIQQSSDITYRVYDYDRIDTEGNTRELHVDAAIEVTNFPHEEVDSRQIKKVIDDLVSTQLVDEKYFSVYHWKLDGEVSRKLESFLLVSVISGKGNVMVDGHAFPVQLGDHFILPSTVEEYIVEGDMEIIASVPGMD